MFYVVAASPKDEIQSSHVEGNTCFEGVCDFDSLK